MDSQTEVFENNNNEIIYDENNLKNQKMIIENILENNPDTRNDDKLLTYLFIKHYVKNFISFEEFKSIPPLANPQKIRQRVQNKEGRFLPTKEVMEKRDIGEKKFRENLNNSDFDVYTKPFNRPF